MTRNLDAERLDHYSVTTLSGGEREIVFDADAPGIEVVEAIMSKVDPGFRLQGSLRIVFVPPLAR
jgi:hypothetical protein